MMRWWPPLLHLLILAAILPIGWHRLEAMRSGPTIVAAEGETPALPAPQDLAALLAAGEAVGPSALLTRPLFVPGRQGAVPDTAETPEPVALMPPEVPRMVGYLNDGTKPRAILAAGARGEEAIVREGDEFIGFTVLQVLPDAVVLRSDGEEITVNMFPQ